MIPHIIEIACPDYTQSRVDVYHMVAKNMDDVKVSVIRTCLSHLERFSKYDFIDCDTWEKFVKEYYCESYMLNLPFDYSVFDIEKNEWSQPWKMSELYSEIFIELIRDLPDDSGDESYCIKHNELLATYRKKYNLKKPSTSEDDD